MVKGHQAPARAPDLKGQECAASALFPGVMNLRCRLCGELLLFLLQEREALALFKRELDGALLRLDRRLIALALERIAVAEIRALELSRRFTEEPVTARLDNRHEFLAEAAGIAVRRQRRIHVVADAVFDHAAAALELIGRDRHRLLPAFARPRCAARKRQA